MPLISTPAESEYSAKYERAACKNSQTGSIVKEQPRRNYGVNRLKRDDNSGLPRLEGGEAAYVKAVGEGGAQKAQADYPQPVQRGNARHISFCKWQKAGPFILHWPSAYSCKM